MDVSAPQAPPSPNPANLALHRAIAYGAGPLLIIAGPGSGKKRRYLGHRRGQARAPARRPGGQVVKAKQEFADQIATASRMTYRIIGGKAVTSGYHALFE